MQTAHGLSNKTLNEVHEILRRHSEVESAVLFGSRAKGNFRNGSDIDLALFGRTLTPATVSRIDMALDDSDLPYRFSLVLLDESLDQDVRAHIERVGHTFYKRD